MWRLLNTKVGARVGRRALAVSDNRENLSAYRNHQRLHTYSVRNIVAGFELAALNV